MDNRKPEGTKKRMIDLLDEFYAERNTPHDSRLAFRDIGRFNGFRIQSMGGEVITLLPPAEKEEKLEVYRKEMNDFAQFLKDKFLAE